MDIDEYLGITYDNKRFCDGTDLNDIFSKHANLKVELYYMNTYFLTLLGEQNAITIIKFINMFQDVNKTEYNYNSFGYTLAKNIIFIIKKMPTYNKKNVFMIMDHLLKLDVDIAVANSYIVSGIFACIEHFNIVTYMCNYYHIIKNTRSLINNHDIILFDINNDIHLIELFLLICKCKHKNLPKFIIIHKILCYYLLYQNYKYNNNNSTC